MLRQFVQPVQVKGLTSIGRILQRRPLLTLAIETSCDDTAVAILETKSKLARDVGLHSATSSDVALRKSPLAARNSSQSYGANSMKATLWFNDRITADNSQYGGIHPIVALESHQRNLASLVQQAVDVLHRRQNELGMSTETWRPDLIAVTRGPGMRSNLATGIDFAKGLSVAWGVPIVGVHHMQAHLLTPRMVAALDTDMTEDASADLAFPFLSLLVSGGHTMLLLSKSLNEHELLSDTDLPLGQALDKLARLILPQHILDVADSTMYGAVLEKFAFQHSTADDDRYIPPRNRAAYYTRSGAADKSWPWSIGVPLAEADGGAKRQSLEYSFSGIVSAVERIMKFDQSDPASKSSPRTDEVSLEERRALAKDAMRVCFEHLASRVLLALDAQGEPVKVVVVSGGVASNHYLRHILRCWLSTLGYPNIEVNFPPPKYCTDNAAMIAWAGVEMYEAGWRSNLGFTARRKWALGSNPNSSTLVDAKGQGEENAVGILDIDCWYNVHKQHSETEDGAQPWPGSTT